MKILDENFVDFNFRNENFEGLNYTDRKLREKFQG